MGLESENAYLALSRVGTGRRGPLRHTPTSIFATQSVHWAMTVSPNLTFTQAP